MSRIFISSECHIDVSRIIDGVLYKIEQATGIIETTDYTNALDSMGIIINSFNKEWITWGFGKPRRYISYKKRYADIRINIPSEDLIAADEKGRLLIIRDNIIESIRVVDANVNKKKGCFFDGERLILFIYNKTSYLIDAL